MIGIPIMKNKELKKIIIIDENKLKNYGKYMRVYNKLGERDNRSYSTRRIRLITWDTLNTTMKIRILNTLETFIPIKRYIVKHVGL